MRRSSRFQALSERRIVVAAVVGLPGRQQPFARAWASDVADAAELAFSGYSDPPNDFRAYTRKPAQPSCDDGWRHGR